MRFAWVALLASFATPATAQAVTSQVTQSQAPVDPARVVAARDLIDTIMPPATRAQMLDNMVRPMLANMQRSIAQDPAFATTFSDDPRARGLFQQFMKREFDRTLTTMQAEMPGMWEAMARAYARRFDVSQMREIKAFFETPTGRFYMQQSLTIMGDPDIAAWQQRMMRQSMAHVQEDVAGFAHDITDLQQGKK